MELMLHAIIVLFAILIAYFAFLEVGDFDDNDWGDGAFAIFPVDVPVSWPEYCARVGQVLSSRSCWVTPRSMALHRALGSLAASLARLPVQLT